MSAEITSIQLQAGQTTTDTSLQFTQSGRGMCSCLHVYVRTRTYYEGTEQRCFEKRDFYYLSIFVVKE